MSAKSRRDILYQYQYLMSRAGQSESRRNRIQNATDRYLANISKSKAYKKDERDFFNAPTSAAERQADYMMQTRQYPRRTYMGLSNG